MVVDQPNTIGALPVAVARDCGCEVAYLPGLARACQVVCVSGCGSFLIQVWFYSVGIVQGEDAKRFVPALSEGAFDEDVVRLMPFRGLFRGV